MQFDILFLHAVDCPDCMIKSIGMFLAALLLGLLLGFILWYRYRRQYAEAQQERDRYHSQFTEMEKDFASLKYQHDELEKDNTGMKTSLRKCEADKAVLSAQLQRARSLAEGNEDLSAKGGPMVVGSRGLSGDTSAYGSVFKKDDLQIVEGIGPKIEQILKEKGIADWAGLAGASAQSLRDILEGEGPSYKMHDPESWPRQARMASEDKWEDLIALQKSLEGGRAEQGTGESPSKVEKLYLKAMGFANAKDSDLTIIEGIGPKIDELLKANGIGTWSALSGASEAQLNQILEAGGANFRLANPSTWAQQASLAAAGKWSELKKLQDALSGGVDK